VDSGGLILVKKPTANEAQHPRALEVHSGLGASEINRTVRAWLRKQHPGASVERPRTTPARLESVRARTVRTGQDDEGQSMQDEQDEP